MAQLSAEQKAIALPVSYGCMKVGKPAAAGTRVSMTRSSTQLAAPGYGVLPIRRHSPVKLTFSRSLSLAGTNHDAAAPGTLTNTWLVVVAGLFSATFRTPSRAPPA